MRRYTHIISVIVLAALACTAGSVVAEITEISTANIGHSDAITIIGSGFGAKTAAEPFRASYLHPDGRQNFQESGSFDAGYWSAWNLVSLQDSVRRIDDRDSHRNYVRVEYREGGTGSGVRVHDLPMTGKQYFAWWDYIAPGFDPVRMHTGCASFKYIYLNAGGHPHEGLQVMQNSKFYGSAHGGVAGDTNEEQDANLTLPFGGGYYGRPISWVADYTLPIGRWYLAELMYDINSAPGTRDGWMEFRIDNELVWRASNVDIFDPGYENDPAFEDISFGGNYGWDGGNDVFYRYYGDIYIDNSFARVVVGDSLDYRDCRHLELQIPTAWADNSITFTVNQGSFQDGETAYLFVVGENGDGDGVGAEDVGDGYPIVFRGDDEPICEAADGSCYYVATNGNDSNDGSFEDPFATIQHGIDEMQPGDILYLRGGVYNEHSIRLWGKQGSEDAWFTVKSYPGEWAVVDGGHPEDDHGVNIFESSSHHRYAPMYWRFEYFEVTGAGPGTENKTYEDIQSLRGAGFHFWPGYNMTFDHLYIHDNYGGGGPNGGAGIKFQNEGGTAVHDVVITHCHLKDNGWHGSTNGNLANIIFFSDYVSDPADVNISAALIRNEISYNLIEGSSIGFKHKNSQMLVRNHIGDDMEAKEWGDRIHHNIFINNPGRGVSVCQDFAQVYNNIIDSSGSGIVVGQPPSSGDREPFHVVVYNNLIINSSSGGGITNYHGSEERVSTYQEEPWHPFWYVYNNVIEDGRDGNGRNDLNLLFKWSEHSVDMNTVQIDCDYFYPRSRDEKVINVVDDANDYSADEYEANGWATNLYANLKDENDPLHPPDSRYKIRQNHNLTGSTTIADGGIGAPHPYLDGVTLPAYVGPCADDDCVWVDEVLALRNLSGSYSMEKMCGDLDGNREIDTVDLLLLLRRVVTGTPLAGDCVCDIDGSGTINVLDARLLMGYIADGAGYSLHCGC